MILILTEINNNTITLASKINPTMTIRVKVESTNNLKVGQIFELTHAGNLIEREGGTK